MNFNTTPLVPNVLKDDMSDKFLEVVDDFSKLTFKDVVDSMPLLHTIESTDASIRYAVLGEREYVNHTESPLVVLALPYANGWTPGKYILAEITRRYIDQNSTMIVFPSPSPHQLDNIVLRGLKSDQVSSGVLDPIAELQLKALRDFNIGSVAFLGYSQGAMLVTHLAEYMKKEVDTLHLVSVEDPGLVEERSKKELQTAFMGDGITSMYDLYSAVRDAGIPLYQQAQGVRVDNRPSVKIIKELLESPVSYFSRTNRSLVSAMTKATSVRALNRLKHTDSNITIVRGEKSKVFTEEAYEKIKKNLGANVTYLTVDGYGHELSDNITSFSLIARKAIQATIDI